VIDAVGLRSKTGRARLAEVGTFFESGETDPSRPLEHEETHLAGDRPTPSQPARSPKH
jgi:hypothetical protein